MQKDSEIYVQNMIKMDSYSTLNFEEISALSRESVDTTQNAMEKLLGRPLTPTEISALESMHSEHASYASSRSDLKNLPTRGFNHVRSIGDEAAVVILGIDKTTNLPIYLVYSSESHNGPSYVCAHPGAATGTGGSQRDNAAISAKNASIIFEARRQAHPLYNFNNDPVEQHTEETTLGIGSYGNAMGIPHGGGSIKFDPRFAGNNIVNVATGTIVEGSERLIPNKVPTIDSPDKFLAIYVGKASDLTGIGGTKFASEAIDMGNVDLNEKAVQDPDSHLQYNVIEGLEKLVDKAIKQGWKDKLSIKDMGAAGLLCSTVEQLHSNIGIVLDGNLVPKIERRTSTELLEAETQERFMIMVHEDYAPKVLEVFNEEIGLENINVGARAAVVGRCNDSGRYIFRNEDVVSVDLTVEELTQAPEIPRERRAPNKKLQALPKSRVKLEDEISRVLGSMNFKSDEPVYGHYDQHIDQTNVVTRDEGAAVLRVPIPLTEHDSGFGYSMTFDSNTVIGVLDPKFQAMDSFMRGAYAMALVGCEVIGATNNANFGRTDVPEEMWEFEQAQLGVTEICTNWDLPQDYINEIIKDSEIEGKSNEDTRRHVTVNSGNCSLNKANKATGTAIPPTTVMGLVGWTDKPEGHTTWDLKEKESTLYLVGKRSKELGGTDYAQAVYGPDTLGDKLFECDPREVQKETRAITHVVREGLVSSANAIEEGGLCNALAEMAAQSKDRDITISLSKEMGEKGATDKGLLFSESYGAVLEISEENKQNFLNEMMERGVEVYKLGTSKVVDVDEGRLNFETLRSGTIRYAQNEIKEAYHTKLERTLSGETINVRRVEA